MPPPKLRYKTFKTGFQGAIQTIHTERIQLLTERIGDIDQLRKFVHQFAKYCFLRSNESNVPAPSLFEKTSTGWTAYYSAFATTRVISEPLRQWYSDFTQDIPIDKNRFRNLSNQYNSHTAGQSASLCKRHVLKEYPKHVYHFVRSHFADQIKNLQHREDRKTIWVYINHMSELLLTASMNSESVLEFQDAPFGFGAMFVSFIQQLNVDMFVAFLDQETRDRQIVELNMDGDEDTSDVDPALLQQWHRSMWYMNRCLDILSETRETPIRLRCVVPLAQGIHQKHIKLYARPLIDMLGDDYSEWKKHDKGVHGVWETVFRPEILDGPKSFVLRNADGSKMVDPETGIPMRYRFARQVDTDGLSGLSLLFVDPRDFSKHVGRSEALGKGRQATKLLTKEQQQALKRAKNLEAAKRRLAAREERKEYLKTATKADKKESKTGVPYFDTLDPDVIRSYTRHIFIDSGHYGHDMIDLRYVHNNRSKCNMRHRFVAEQRHRLHVTGANTKRHHASKREKHHQLDHNQCSERVALDSESKYAIRSVSFLRYCVAFNTYASKVLSTDPTYNLWHSYQKLRTHGLTIRYESHLIKRMRKRFGDPRQRRILVILGDYSSTYHPAMRGTTPAFVTGFARLLVRSGYDVTWIDEYNTSKLYHATHLPGEQAHGLVWRTDEANPRKCDRQWKRKKKRIVVSSDTEIKQVSRELHAVKLFKTVSELKAFVNRDINACLNFRYIVQYWLENGYRPPEYCRQ